MERDLTDPLEYEYIGGGYFRLKGVPRGQKGNALSGTEYAKLVAETITRLKGQQRAHEPDQQAGGPSQ